ncbi:MAG: prepilin peptidase [Candidatus Dadabacteria bacterium]|nr:MAG: prepilin peptidase [Candidatus Dadabacteria bacterium]
MDMSTTTLFIALLAGLAAGSFMNVIIYRLPAGREELYEDSPYYREGEEQIRLTLNEPKRSICPKCKHSLPWKYTIPVISWVLLRGRCAYCSHKIPFRYTFVELITAALFVLSVSMFGGLTPTSVGVIVFSCALIVISFIDYDHYIIPNVISIPGVFIGIALAGLNQFTGILKWPFAPDLLSSGYGILIGGGFLWLVAFLYYLIRKTQGLGMGDVKLLAMTGAFLGPEAAYYTILVGSILGSIVGIILIVFYGKKTTHQIPFGPYLAGATLLYIFTSSHIMTGFEGVLAVR